MTQHPDSPDRTLLYTIAAFVGFAVLWFGVPDEVFSTWLDRAWFALCAAGAVVGLATGLHADDLDGEQATMPSFWVVLRSAAFLAIAFVVVAGPEPAPLWGTGLALFVVLVLGRLVLPSTPTRRSRRAARPGHDIDPAGVEQARRAQTRTES